MYLKDWVWMMHRKPVRCVQPPVFFTSSPKSQPPGVRFKRNYNKNSSNASDSLSFVFFQRSLVVHCWCSFKPQRLNKETRIQGWLPHLCEQISEKHIEITKVFKWSPKHLWPSYNQTELHLNKYAESFLNFEKPQKTYRFHDSLKDPRWSRWKFHPWFNHQVPSGVFWSSACDQVEIPWPSSDCPEDRSRQLQAFKKSKREILLMEEILLTGWAWWFIPLSLRFYTSQVVQDFFHAQDYKF